MVVERKSQHLLNRVSPPPPVFYSELKERKEKRQFEKGEAKGLRKDQKKARKENRNEAREGTPCRCRERLRARGCLRMEGWEPTRSRASRCQEPSRVTKWEADTIHREAVLGKPG